EGYTGLTFQETLALLNPGPTASGVQLRLLPLSGRPARMVAVTVGPQQTRLLNVNALMPNQSVGVIARATRPIVLVRTLTFGPHGYGMTIKTGTTMPATSWFFAEGTTHFQTFLTILNPTTEGALVSTSFYGQTTDSVARRSLYVRGLSRATIKLNDVL